MSRKLVRLCVHEQIRSHEIHCGSSNCLVPQDHEWCDGGEFLPEDALVIEPGSALMAELVHGPGPDRLRGMIGEYQRERHITADWVTSNIERLALIVELAADQVGEPGPTTRGVFLSTESGVLEAE